MVGGVHLRETWLQMEFLKTPCHCGCNFPFVFIENKYKNKIKMSVAFVSYTNEWANARIVIVNLCFLTLNLLYSIILFQVQISIVILMYLYCCSCCYFDYRLPIVVVIRLLFGFSESARVCVAAIILIETEWQLKRAKQTTENQNNRQFTIDNPHRLCCCLTLRPRWEPH